MQFRRFAYLRKRDWSEFGLLEAADSRDARQHLGTGYHIRQTWLTAEEHTQEHFDRDLRWRIVSSIFLSPLSDGYIRKNPVKS
jgi:hypothetical protein